MLVSEAIFDLRSKVNDKEVVEYTDEELLANINEAIQYVGAYLISQKSPLAVEEFVIDEKEFETPRNFTVTAGTFPIKITGNKGILLDEPPLTVRYFATYQDLTYEDEMPYNHAGLWPIIIKLASIYALNRNEFNIQQDKALLDEVNAQLANIANQ